MTETIQQHPKSLKIDATRFKTIVAEANEGQTVTLKLPASRGVAGFIVFLQPALPSII